VRGRAISTTKPDNLRGQEAKPTEVGPHPEADLFWGQEAKALSGKSVRQPAQ
jgi:hypothetical protein